MNLGKENEFLEFKKSTGELKEGIISLTAILNKNNYGTLYFGVKDNGDVIGQQIGDRTLRDISQGIANFIKPQIIPTITLELIDEMNVIKVEVSGNEKPYSAYGKYYMRSFDEDRELSPNQLKSLMQTTANMDEIITISSNDQNLSFNQFKNLLINNNLSINESTFENNFSLKNKENKYNLMAELLSDKNDVSIKVVTFRGTDKTDMIKRNEYGFKCLILAMDQVLSYVEAINETLVKLNNHQRIEETLFDFKCFKEAWQNACIHNKWCKLNSPAVYIFSDRIEIVSTGGLPDDMNETEFYKGISKPVNGKLQKICGQLGYVEQTGHGIPLIINKYGRQAFDIMDNFIIVTIPFNKGRLIENNTIIHDGLNENQKRVYLLLKDNPTLTIVSMVNELGLSNGYVRKIIDQLKEKGIIERKGSNKNGFWQIK